MSDETDHSGSGPMSDETVEPGSRAMSDEHVEARPRRRAPYIVAAVAIVLVAFVAVLARGKGGEATRQPSALLGRPAPAIAGSTIDGGAFDLSTRKGSWVLVNSSRRRARRASRSTLSCARSSSGAGVPSC